MASQKHGLSQRWIDADRSAAVAVSKLAAEAGDCINLGRGFSDYMPPSVATEALRQVAFSSDPSLHQSTRSSGHPRLVKALSETYSTLFVRNIDPNDEILCTIGAYGSLFCAVQGLVNPGDEVIVIEPYFIPYAATVRASGGIPVFIPLKPCKRDNVISSADWKLDMHELASKFNSRTKLMLLNNPNNPLGKVMTLEELEMIAELCCKHDVVVVSDEVYEWLVYPPLQHIRIATLPGMWERTVTVGSAGKSFSVTGWRLGWSIGPSHLIRTLRVVHENSNFDCFTPLQEAVAICFENEQQRINSADCYFNVVCQELRPKRDKMARYLQEVGVVPTVPEGGYFMVADFSNLQIPFDEHISEPSDFQLVRGMIRSKKLASLPLSAFYSEEHKHLAGNRTRFCFFKEDKTLDKAGDILRQWMQSVS